MSSTVKLLLGSLIALKILLLTCLPIFYCCKRQKITTPEGR
jgi:hypothetical protein